MSGTIDIERRLSETFDASEMAWWEMELPSGAVFFHPNKAKMFGGKPDEFIHYTSFTSRLSKSDYKKSMQAMENHLKGKTDFYRVIYQVKGLDGVKRLLYDRGKIIKREKDGTIKITGIIVDLTEIVKDEKSTFSDFI